MATKPATDHHNQSPDDGKFDCHSSFHISDKNEAVGGCLLAPQVGSLLGNLLHRASLWRRQGSARRLKMLNHFLHDLAELRVEANGIISVNAGDQVRASSNINTVFLAPLDPFVVMITGLHCCGRTFRGTVRFYLSCGFWQALRMIFKLAPTCGGGQQGEQQNPPSYVGGYRVQCREWPNAKADFLEPRRWPLLDGRPKADSEFW